MTQGRDRETPNRPSGGAVTLDDVAKLAGVSTATVSRTLNHPDRVTRKTRDKIDAAIARTGYVPNLLAGGLASRRSRLIAAVVYSMENVVHAETIKYFSRRLRRNGYQVLLGETEYQETLEEELVAALLCRRPDGILLTGGKHTAALGGDQTAAHQDRVQVEISARRWPKMPHSALPRLISTTHGAPRPRNMSRRARVS